MSEPANYIPINQDSIVPAPAWGCRDCGAVVHDPQQHNVFHRGLDALIDVVSKRPRAMRTPVS